MYVCVFRVVKSVLTRRGRSKSLNMSHSRSAGFSNSGLHGEIVDSEKSRKHALRCASVSQNICPAGHVPSIDSLPSIRSGTFIGSPSVVYQRIGPIREPPSRLSFGLGSLLKSNVMIIWFPTVQKGVCMTYCSSQCSGIVTTTMWLKSKSCCAGGSFLA